MPFYLRTGKRLAEGQRIISIAFREPPKSMFPAGSGVGAQGPDHLTFDLADASKMSLSFYGKRPGPGMRLDKLSLQFAMHDTGLIGDVLEAYERLILDAMRGDHTLFTTAEGIERLWEVSTPLLEAPPPVRLYAPGSWGPNVDPPAGRPARLATALRAGLARSEPGRRLTAKVRTERRTPRVQPGGGAVDERIFSSTGSTTCLPVSGSKRSAPRCDLFGDGLADRGERRMGRGQPRAGRRSPLRRPAPARECRDARPPQGSTRPKARTGR